MKINNNNFGNIVWSYGPINFSNSCIVGTGSAVSAKLITINNALAKLMAMEHWSQVSN